MDEVCCNQHWKNKNKRTQLFAKQPKSKVGLNHSPGDWTMMELWVLEVIAESGFGVRVGLWRLRRHITLQSELSMTPQGSTLVHSRHSPKKNKCSAFEWRSAGETRWHFHWNCSDSQLLFHSPFAFTCKCQNLLVRRPTWKQNATTNQILTQAFEHDDATANAQFQ